jgi:hypothetical protein
MGRLAIWLSCFVILATGMAPRRLQAADDADERPPTFELLVVGPDEKPVPRAAIAIRTQPPPSAEQIQQGEFIQAGPGGATLNADANGRLLIKLPAQPQRFNINITTAGFGPYLADWTSDNFAQPLPAKFTAELEAGWSVGGVIIGEDGRPLKGAKVSPSIRFKKRPGDMSELYVGTNIQTDAEGRWRFDCVPVSLNQVGVEITHPQFAPLRRGLARNQFELKPGEQPSENVTLQRGLVVKGTITDEQGQPIAGALVRTKFVNDIREATTNAAGIYQLVGCEPRMAKVIASAKGRAIDMQEVRVEPDMQPVDFQLKPGGQVRIRVVDEQGQGIPKARIFFQGWRGRYDYFEFNVNQYADENGLWQWNEAPLDGFLADICRPDGMQLGRQLIGARDEEYVFRPPPALVVSGKVVDAETKEPIPSFRVVPGTRSDDLRTNWLQGPGFASKDGQYTMRQTHDSFAWLVRIEASGYLPIVSRDIKSHEGNVTIDFELKKGKDVAATLLTPEGKPAAKAKLALGVAGSQISIKNGDFDGQTYAKRVDADDAGRFSIPPPGSPFQLVILHPSGYAHVKSDGEPAPETIQLTAWAKVEGTYRVGKQAVAGVPIEIGVDELHSHGNDVPHILTGHEATTGADGRFVFERVIPGLGWIARELHFTVDDGVLEPVSSVRYMANFAAGETTKLDVGGTGVPVIGKLQPPAGFVGIPRWNFALVAARLDLPQPLLAASPYITATVGRDGAFRIDDMPAGEYLLNVRFNKDPVGRLSNVRFLVPPADGDHRDRPLDLGTLNLER